ncbi:MAG: flagellar brake domain-containing protein [Desulfitobacteriaceae bacterium]
MSRKKKLFPGTTIELVIPDGDYKGNYHTRVDEVGERIISVTAPYHQGEVVPLRVGTVLEVIYYDEVSAYSFDTRIKQRIAVPIPIFVLDFPEEIRKVQRRNYVRIPAIYPLTFRMVTKEGLSDLKAGNMLDISGGGIRFRTVEKLENNSLLYAQLKLPSGELNTPVRVRRVLKIEDTKAYSISAEFYEISERDRDRVIRCVFELQRTMRKKGLF